MKKLGFVGVLAAALMLSFTTTNNEITVINQDGIVNPTGNIGLNVGDTAPDLAYKSPDGKEIKLSSLRGSVVLIDFWASWCGPCRRENPNIVSAYDKYSKAKFKDAKGFEIYSVSLDKNQAAWVAAIEQDQLKWPYHVSDLGGWSSAPAAVYQVRSIPASFLIDANGVIIAKNLRGQTLHLELDKLVKKL